MKKYVIKNREEVSSEVLYLFKLLRDDIISLLANAPEYGVATLEAHFVNGEIKRIRRRREESIALTKGGSKC